jgi:hypothetical protein
MHITKPILMRINLIIMSTRARSVEPLVLRICCLTMCKPSVGRAYDLHKLRQDGCAKASVAYTLYRKVTVCQAWMGRTSFGPDRNPRRWMLRC